MLEKLLNCGILERERGLAVDAAEWKRANMIELQGLEFFQNVFYFL